LKIAILSSNPNLYSTRRLVEAAQQRGHEAQIVDTLRCYMNISTQPTEIHYKGGKLEPFDAVIPRIGAPMTTYGTAVLRQFEVMGVYPANGSAAISRARDKLLALQLLARAGIPMPITGFAYSPDDIDDLIKMVRGAPLVIKLLRGAQGIGVVLAETNQAAASVIQAFLDVRADILVQEFVKEAEGSDIRCFVIGEAVVAAMKRQAKEGDFRSNLHRGGTASPVQITEEERGMALRATRVMGLNIAGIDILRSDRGPLVLEVNSTPGLEGIESVTGMDIAGMIVEFVARNADRGGLPR
jgi:ribosomal protein S6--L-glutamate ligase